MGFVFFTMLSFSGKPTCTWIMSFVADAGTAAFRPILFLCPKISFLSDELTGLASRNSSAVFAVFRRSLRPGKNRVVIKGNRSVICSFSIYLFENQKDIPPG